MKLYARRGFEWAEDGLVGLWSPVSTGATQGILLDCNLSSNNHGTLTGYTDINAGWQGSDFGAVLNADGVDDRVLTSPWRGMAGAYSVAAWIRTTYSGTGTMILGSSFLGSNGVHLMGVRGSDGAVYGFAGSERWFTGVACNDGNWHFATITRPNTNAMTCFVDRRDLGSLSGGQSYDPGLGNNWGFFRTGFGAQWIGQAAEIAMFGRAITLTQHQEMYQAGPGGMWQDRPRRSRVYFSSAGFRAYWARRQSQLIGGGV